MLPQARRHLLSGDGRSAPAHGQPHADGPQHLGERRDTLRDQGPGREPHLDPAGEARIAEEAMRTVRVERGAAGTYNPCRSGMEQTEGTRLGPYEVVGMLGAGGMGEVYRARDPRIGREVAVKVMRATASEPMLQRLGREARVAGSLNHPNILAVFDVGVHEGRPYVVSELLEGETLRSRLLSGGLPPRKAAEVGCQVALGLAAAHDKGIVHRDVKPENLFLLSDGRVKILDFGLARQSPLPTSDDSPTTSLDGSPPTDAGVVLGTVGYMSPEQVSGAPADHRSDVFSLGIVLHEMLAGTHPFRRPTSVETLHAILKEDPPDLLEVQPRLSPALGRLVRRCLEKRPGERFQSARDLAFHLQEVDPGRSTGSRPLVTAPVSRRRLAAAALVAGLAAAAYGGWRWMPEGRRDTAQPVFQQLTFQRGTVMAARLAPDGEGVLYAAAWAGRPVEVFLTMPSSPESRSLTTPGTSLFSVSRTGELALCLRCELMGRRRVGVLARMPLGGGTPREVLEQVEAADWGPDGTLAAVRRLDGNSASRLEYPVGTEVHRSPGAIRDVRVAPDGERVAFVDDVAGHGVGGEVAWVDRRGSRTRVAGPFADVRGLAWHGRELWFTASEGEGLRELLAASPGSPVRTLLRGPGSLTLADVSPDGRGLLTRDDRRDGILAADPASEGERDLSWFAGSAVADLFPDGRLLFGDVARGRSGVYLRPADGAPPIRLADGFADALSPDGRWAATTSAARDQVVLVPTGPGEPRALPGAGLTYSGTLFFPDGRHLLVTAREGSRGFRSYVYPLEGGAPRPVTPEGTWARAISPDGSRLACSTASGLSVLAVDPPEARPVKGSLPSDRIAGWCAGGRALWVLQQDGPATSIARLDLASGERRPWRRLRPPDATGLQPITEARVTPDGRLYAYSYERVLSELFLVGGLR